MCKWGSLQQTIGSPTTVGNRVILVGPNCVWKFLFIFRLGYCWITLGVQVPYAVLCMAQLEVVWWNNEFLLQVQMMGPRKRLNGPVLYLSTPCVPQE